ncbi:MAG TPA: 3-phosphoshikimate 1-carboxyvinyltransferase [Fervidobacterium sp.]|nr:3-phosphoshikimate 1-carboxyvinyltransferase [Fervidobacterium sp.]HOV53342.1 3-phosphoshikimate 1-carboxyvinyltransferase [Fervidobacterium sp.]HRB90842.1 3-phosphoshikimate 1-carboxyvinyltransferase [Fervidobacterium sp.]
MHMRISPCEGIDAEITVPGDKSISHRALMIGAIANGKTQIRNFLDSDDTSATMEILRAMGIEIERKENEVIVEGKGLYGLSEPEGVLDARNSGTTMRLLLGLLAAQSFYAVITGDESLRKRPMKRVIEPLSKMGSQFFGRQGGSLAPITVIGNQNLRPVTYRTPVASAQVKSAILLAGLYADGDTTVIEPAKSRDHTERMLRCFGAQVYEEGTSVTIHGIANKLEAKEIFVPGDISSAAFFIVAGLITKGSKLVIKDVGLNPTRTGILTALREMGGDISVVNERIINYEPVGDLIVRSSELKGIEIKSDTIPLLIDEIPILAIAASQASGKTSIRDAQELRYKETDRIRAIATELRRLGVEIEERQDGFDVVGRQEIKGNCTCESYKDHRIAMSLAIAGLIAQEPIEINDFECVNISFPNFAAILNSFYG